jgi:hypothetical protein
MKFSLKLVKMLGILVVLTIMLMAPAAMASASPVLVVSAIKVVPGASATTTSPGPLMPGDTGTVVVTIMNTLKAVGQGNSTTASSSYNYWGSHQTPDTTQTISTQSSDAPSGTSLVRFVNLLENGPVKVISQPYVDVGSLGMGDSATFEFAIKADENAADGKYYLPLKIKTDRDDVYINQVVPVVIDGSGVHVVLNDAPASLSTARSSIVLDVVNYRPNGVTSVSVVPTGDEFSFKPKQEYTVGNIGSGEMYTVSFDVTSKTASYNGTPSFVVKYKNGDNWHQTQPVTVHVEPKTATAANTGAQDNTTLLYLFGGIVLLAVIVGAIFLFMRSQRAKK